MARQYGIITSHEGAAGIVVQSLTTTEGIDIAEARDETGKITDRKAYSRNTQVSIKGLLDVAKFTIHAGDTLTLNSVSYLIESCEQSETNTGFAEVSITAKTADSATIAPYAAAGA